MPQGVSMVPTNEKKTQYNPLKIQEGDSKDGPIREDFYQAWVDKWAKKQELSDTQVQAALADTSEGGGKSQIDKMVRTRWVGLFPVTGPTNDSRPLDDEAADKLHKALVQLAEETAEQERRNALTPTERIAEDIALWEKKKSSWKNPNQQTKELLERQFTGHIPGVILDMLCESFDHARALSLILAVRTYREGEKIENLRKKQHPTELDCLEIQRHDELYPIVRMIHKFMAQVYGFVHNRDKKLGKKLTGSDRAIPEVPRHIYQEVFDALEDTADTYGFVLGVKEYGEMLQELSEEEQ